MQFFSVLIFPFSLTNYHLFCWNLAEMEGWKIQNQKIKLINLLCWLVQTFALICANRQPESFLNLLPGWLPRLLLLHKRRGFMRQCNMQASVSLIGFFWRRGTKWLVSHRGQQKMGETFTVCFKVRRLAAETLNSETWILEKRKSSIILNSLHEARSSPPWVHTLSSSAADPHTSLYVTAWAKDKGK